MFKRTIFGLTLAPAFALGVALTAYAANGWHGDPSALRNRAPTGCDTAAAVHVEQPAAIRLPQLTSGHAVRIAPRPAKQVAPRPAAPAPCVAERNRS